MQASRSSFFDRRSLRTRIIAGVLLAVVASLWLATLWIGHTLRQDMEAAISAQQYSAVSLMAREVDRSVRERLRVLESLAARITPELLADPAALQDQIQQQVGVPVLFNWGVMVLDQRGVALASVPATLQRSGTAYGEMPFVRDALARGTTVVSDPLTGLRTGQPLVSMAAAVRHAPGEVAGLVIGVTNLARPNFLDELSDAKYGRTGDFLITAPRSRIFIASSDKRRVMNEGPPRGVNPVYDSYLDGREGSGVALSSRGVVELSSNRRIPSTGWLMQSVLPAEEAFAPVRAMQRQLAAISVVLTVLAGAIAAWWLRREFRPLVEAATRLAQMRDGTLPREPLPVRRDDEIGALARAFNGLLVVIMVEEAKTAERRADQRLRKIVARVPGVVFQFRRGVDGHGSFPFASGALRDIFGLTPDKLESDATPLRELLHPDDAARFLATQQASAEGCTPWRVQFRSRATDGTTKWLLMDAVPERGDDGSVTWYGSITDFTEAKATEEQLRIAAATFEGHEGIFITDAEGRILRVNQAFTAMTGYGPEEAVGRTPALLKSGRHDDEFYRLMWAALAREGYWCGEIWNRHKNGELYPEWATISAVKDADGRVTHYVAAFSDITEQKQAEEQIQRLAFYDPLTDLPNRRLFLDRLEQALAVAARSRAFGALMFIDLDQFKALNDLHGHVMGDELLLQVAQRLSRCVRASDSVARLGGDEFVVMLQDVALHPEGAHGARAQAHAVAAKIGAALAEPYRLEPAGRYRGQPVAYRCTASIGISLFDGDSPGSDELIRQADHAMYVAKAAGGNAIRFYDGIPGPPPLATT